MRVIKTIFKIIGLFLLISILTLTYLIIHLDEHKGLLEYSASKALGREIRIEHDLALNWSLNPLITFKGLRVANPDWASEKYLIDAERVVLQLDLTQLLHHLTIKNVRLQNADIFLETATDGRRNWIFGDGSTSGIDIRINTLQVETSYLHYGSSKGVNHPIEITHLELLDVSADEHKLKTNLTYRDVPLSISAIFGPDKISHSDGWPFKGQLTSGDAIMDFSGHMTAQLEFSDLGVEFHSDQLDLPQALLSMWPSLPVRQVSAQLKTKGSTPKLLLRNLSGKITIGSARLSLAAKNKDKAKAKAKAKAAILTGTSISIEPNQPVQLETRLMYEEQSFQLELTGGRLAELFFVDHPWKVLRMKAHTQLDKKRIEIAGTFGPLSAALIGRNLDIDLVTHYEGMKARFNGKVARFNDFEDSQLVITVSGPDLSRLKPWLGVDLPENLPFTFDALLKESKHRLVVKDLKATIGESDIAGTLSLPLIQGERIEATLKSSIMDLRAFLSTDHEIVDGAQVKLLEQELPLDALDKLNGAFQFEVGRLLVGDIKIDDVQLDATLDIGRLKLTMIAGGERLSTNVDLKSEDKQWRLSLHHKGKLDVAWLLKKEKKSNDRSHAPLALDVKLSGTGRSLTAVLASAEGHLEMVLGTGQLTKNVSRYFPLGSVLFALLDTINPADKVKRQSGLECAVFKLNIANGTATSTKGLALRTDNINALGGGALNLSTGEVDIQFKTVQRKGLGVNIPGIADKYIRITGTLSQPRIGLNVGSYLMHGAAAWATDGISLLYEDLINRLTASSNPCETVL